MPRTGSVERERIVAWLAVLGMHLLFWWMLTRATTVTVSSGDASEALQVTWIAPSPLPRPAATAIAPSPPPPSARTRDRKPDPQATQPIVTVQQPPAPAASMSTVFIEQARHLPGARDQGDAFARDPLANRHARLPGTQAEAFRMREPLSPQRVLRRIGALLAGSEYTTDPCPRIRENIAGLAPGGDDDLLQEELRRQRAYCH